MSNQLSLSLGAQLIQAHNDHADKAQYIPLINLFVSVLETLDYTEEYIVQCLIGTKEMMYITEIAQALSVAINEF
jgi:hypothetical protein